MRNTSSTAAVLVFPTAVLVLLVLVVAVVYLVAVVGMSVAFSDLSK